jgi:hypothetical protein
MSIPTITDISRIQLWLMVATLLQPADTTEEAA